MNNLENSVVANAARLSCRQILRQATHGAHVSLNHHPLLAGIVRPAYTLTTYARVLVAYFHLYRSLETAITDFMDDAALTFDYAARCKTPLLAADLRVLGIDADDPAWRPPQPLGAVPIMNAAQLVGVLYTIEGATLGGQVITRHIEANLGLAIDSGARFFNGYGIRTEAHWSQFEAFMESACGSADERACAALSARATFAAMEGVLNDYAV